MQLELGKNMHRDCYAMCCAVGAGNLNHTTTRVLFLHEPTSTITTAAAVATAVTITAAARCGAALQRAQQRRGVCKRAHRTAQHSQPRTSHAPGWVGHLQRTNQGQTGFLYLCSRCFLCDGWWFLCGHCPASPKRIHGGSSSSSTTTTTNSSSTRAIPAPAPALLVDAARTAGRAVWSHQAGLQHQLPEAAQCAQRQSRAPPKGHHPGR